MEKKITVINGNGNVSSKTGFVSAVMSLVKIATYKNGHAILVLLDKLSRSDLIFQDEVGIFQEIRYLDIGLSDVLDTPRIILFHVHSQRVKIPSKLQGRLHNDIRFR